MERTKNIFIAAVLITVTSLTLLYGHSGRTDANGGHYDRKTGTYHYHNSGTRTATPAYTQPASSPTNNRLESLRTPAPAPAPVVPEPEPVVLPDWEVPEQKPVSVTENFWQVALNNVLKGKMEVPIATGRVDIVTDSQAIEVDKVSNYAAGTEQALKYAQATGKIPVLAVYIDGERDGLELLQKADVLCKSKGVQLLLVNSYVSVADMMSLVSVATANRSKTTTIPTATRTADKPAVIQTPAPAPAAASTGYWLNTSSNTRHNSACRYYYNTKNGRACTKDEGRACGICGG